MNNNGRFGYPEELEGPFAETGDLNFKDGSNVSASEVWKFMTRVAPEKFPYAFDTSSYYIGKLSDDVDSGFLSGIKRGYLTLTMRDRLLKAHDKGVPIVLIQGGQPMEPYFAAGGISLRPGFIMQWARDMQDGLNLRGADLRGIEILESGRKSISIESCNQVAAHAAIDNGIVPVDLIAPYLCLRCSDMAYLVESHRNKTGNLPSYLVDYPINQENKEWAVDYIAEMLRTLTEKVSSLSGKKINEEELINEIRLHNRIRKLTREYAKLWWSAEIPPTNSVDHGNIIQLGNEPRGEPTATGEVLKESYEEVKERIKHSVKGKGLVDDPKRLFVCGSCVGPNPYNVEKAGGVLVGRDDNWSVVCTDVKENGNPYENLARAMLSFPYEQPTEKRAEWTADQVKNSRADGLMFMYQWGCNYQTAVARMMADIIKERTGVPTTFIEIGELGRLEALAQSENRVEAFIEMLR